MIETRGAAALGVLDLELKLGLELGGDRSASWGTVWGCFGGSESDSDFCIVNFF